MQKTSIEWTDYTSNPIRAVDPATGKRGWACTKVSAGCDHCYAEVLNRRWGTRHDFTKANEAAVEWRLIEEELRDILRSRATGVRVFVGDMTDLFHRQVENGWLDRLFAVFALRPDLTFQLLTKRPQLAYRYLAAADTPQRASYHLKDFWEVLGKRDLSYGLSNLAYWPLPNVWLGASVERMRETWRIPALLACPAAVHFLSCEPLIGPLSVARWLLPDEVGNAVDWVIVGGESGAGYRALDLRHARALRDECAAHDCPFFFKQVGGFTPKAGGRLLDGVEHSQFPASRAVAAI